MADKKLHKTRLIVRELREIHRGKTTNQVEYIMYQVVATKPDGVPIDLNLRTFEELPRNEVIEVTVEKFQSDQYGESFTLKQVGKQNSRDLIKALTERVKKLEQTVYSDDPYSGGGRVPPPQPATTQAAPPAPPPPAPAAPPTAPPVQRALPSDDDIPF